MNYQNFFKACKKNLYFETERGDLTVYELFQLTTRNLKEIYVNLKQKAVVDDDPILAETSGTYSDDLLRFEIVKDIIIYRKDQAKRNELLEKKKQLKKMLSEIEMNRLKEDPKAISEQLEEIEKKLEG